MASINALDVSLATSNKITSSFPGCIDLSALPVDDLIGLDSTRLTMSICVTVSGTGGTMSITEASICVLLLCLDPDAI